MDAAKFLCGNVWCVKGRDYCYDPDGRHDVDYMNCKQCSYSLDQCNNGDFVSGCLKFCLELIKEDISSNHTCPELEYDLNVTVFLSVTIGFMFIMLCLCCVCLKPKGKYKKLLSRCPGSGIFMKKTCSTVLKREPSAQVKLLSTENRPNNKDKEGDSDTESEQQNPETMPKSISSESVENTGDERSHSSIVDITGVPPDERRPNAVDGTQVVLDPRPNAVGGTQEAQDERAIRLGQQPRLNGIKNSTNDEPKQCIG